MPGLPIASHLSTSHIQCTEKEGEEEKERRKKGKREKRKGANGIFPPERGILLFTIIHDYRSHRNPNARV